MSVDGGGVSLAKLAFHRDHERGLVMKPGKGFCCVCLFAFSVLALHKTQFYSDLSPPQRLRHLLQKSNMRGAPYVMQMSLSSNLSPNERLRDECSPKAD